MTIIRIAIRNLMRNKRRVLITTSAMAFALFIMIIYKGLYDGFLVEFEHNAVSLDLSRAQIHAPEYRAEPSIYTTIKDSEVLIDNLKKAGYSASSRLYGFALAAADNNSAGVTLRGVDIHREKQVTELYKHLKTGKWLSENAASEVVIGGKLARTLGVDLGSEIVIVGQAVDGSIANELYTVRGILKTVSSEIDRGGFFMTGPAFRELMAFENGVHEIAINFPREKPLEDAVLEIREISPDAEVLSWRELAPELSQMFDASNVSMIFMYVISYAAIALVTLNAMLMAVFERIREFGIMKAVGVSPRQIWRMVIIEAFCQVLLACVVGAALGIPVVLYLQTHGINYSAFGDGATISGVALDPIWTSYVTLRTVFEPMIFMAVMVLLAVIYPGLKAALIQPVKAIYHR